MRIWSERVLILAAVMIKILTNWRPLYLPDRRFTFKQEKMRLLSVNITKDKGAESYKQPL